MKNTFYLPFYTYTTHKSANDKLSNNVADDFVSKRRFTKRDRNLLNCSQFYWHTCVYGSLAHTHLFRLVTKISLLARARDMPQWAIVMHDAMRCSTPEQTYKRDTDVKRRTPHTFIYELWKFFAFDHRFVGFLHWFARLVCSGGWKQWFCNIAVRSISLCHYWPFSFVYYYVGKIGKYSKYCNHGANRWRVVVRN